MLPYRTIAPHIAAVMLLTVLCSVPRYAFATNAQGSSCPGGAVAPIVNSANSDGNNLVCISGTWQYPAYSLQSYSGAAGASCSGYPAGALHYTTTIANLEYCNGSVWSQLAQVQPASPPTAPAGAGYFVLTHSTYTDPGSFAAANSTCLTDLTTNTGWNGYSSANSRGILIATHVLAWVCPTGGACQNLMPITTYYYANGGNGAAGGASFTTDSNGAGPGDTVAWSAANRFSGVFGYWTGRGWSGAGTATVWSTSTSQVHWGIDDATVETGMSSATDTARWTNGGIGSGSSEYLICMVNP